MIDFLKTFFEAWHNRLRNPILGAYTCSFLIWNWKAVLIICFSNYTIEDRIFYIENWIVNKWSIIGPLVLTALVVIGIPFIMAYLDKVLEEPNLKRRKIKEKFSEENLKHNLTVASYEYMIEEQKTGKKTIEEFTEKINVLTEQKDAAEKLLNAERENIANERKNLAGTINQLSANNNNYKNKTVKSLHEEITNTVHVISKYLKQNDLENEFVEKFPFDGSEINRLSKLTREKFESLKLYDKINGEYKASMFAAATFVSYYNSVFQTNAAREVKDIYLHLSQSEREAFYNAGPHGWFSDLTVNKETIERLLLASLIVKEDDKYVTTKKGDLFKKITRLYFDNSLDFLFEKQV